jgi:uroporphyrinogen decarboxylase
VSGRADLFLRACAGEPVERTPVWIMRQAGRYLPEYRALKDRYDFLTLCKTPELAAQVTLQPVERLGVDAAILFSDILVPLEPMGVGLRFEPGPVLERPINTAEAVSALRPLHAEESCAFVMDTIRLLRRELEGKIPLIGFCGAPFTLAAYLVESREKGKTKGTFDGVVRMIFEEPELAHRLLRHLGEAMTDYLSAQIKAGAQAVQIFDSWGGILGPREFREFALPYVRRMIAALPAGRGPVIYFVLNGGHLLESIRESGAEVIGLDWRTPLQEARRRVGPCALQGNLDPRALFATKTRLAEEVRRVLAEGSGSGGHVFNLGHGILPDTPVESTQALVDLVHRLSERPTSLPRKAD